ncbi:glycine--tRNA ligase subunit beta [Metallibacterium scheffleri]|uniref:Glycine--tRNA ligase beta subunit n=2 Tax=root TaxID=1 RepID=A0A4S3KUT5_9GAMM|nr:glycine--tRNA ligase subunit beta [Metallibacterium scheffleri]THD12248.1 glycine--tRNA ligase subunit beta [Metallibacterium scheffleri]
MAESAGKPLLIELGVEELPIAAVDTLAVAFFNAVRKGLETRHFGIGREELDRTQQFYCSPRRLAVYLPWVACGQPRVHTKVLGPAVSMGLDAAGQAAAALRGFAAKIGVAVESLTREMTDKGERYVYVSEDVGQPLAALLPEILAEAVKALPIAKPMRWGAHAWSFVRPLHWLVVLHGDQVIEAELFGIRSTRHSRGHRFMADKPVWITDADAYVEALRGAKVIADPAQRRERIHGEVARVAAQLGGMPQMDDALLEQIANLTEWPVAIGCSFDASFLAVPQEALVATMVANQKFVPLLDDHGALLPRFIGVANIESRDETRIRHGYERVIRPRFADAKFFFDKDLKTPLATHQKALAAVVDQSALGSLWDKSVRVAELARVIANRVGADAAQAAHAASLAKCDLLTRMVGEFPELQGVMGRTYALAQGESPEIARALDEVYMPRGAGDTIAGSALGRVLAVAERADTLAGLFAIGGKPGGAKDPYALRRAALGLARTLIEGGLQLDTRGLLLEALDAIPETALAAGLKAAKVTTALDAGARRAALAAEIERFIIERLRGYYAEQGIAAGVFEAVLAVAPSSLVDFDRRLRALADFTRTPECATLVTANKRVANILRKQAETGDAAAAAINSALLEVPAERALVEALAAVRHASTTAATGRDYAGALAHLAALDAPLARFFDEVMVVAEDPAVRGNRLALLAQIRAAFNAIADIALV